MTGDKNADMKFNFDVTLQKIMNENNHRDRLSNIILVI